MGPERVVIPTLGLRQVSELETVGAMINTVASVTTRARTFLASEASMRDGLFRKADVAGEAGRHHAQRRHFGADAPLT